jgi:hypothetical protein
MKSFVKYYFYLLLFAPIFGYISYQITGFDGRQMLSYLALPLYLLFLLGHNRKIIIPRFIGIFIIYVIYVYIWNILIGVIEDKGFLKFIFNNFHIYFILVLIIIYNVTITDKTYNKFTLTIKLLLLVALIGSLIQFFIDPNWMIRPADWEINSGNIYLDRRPSVYTYVSPNDYGISILAFFSLILAIQIKSRNIKWIILFIIMVGLYSFLSNSRYVMLSFIIVLVQIYLSSENKIKILTLFYSIIALGILYYIYTVTLGVNLQKLSEERLFAEGSIQATSRYGAFINFLEFFPQNPIFGNGYQVSKEVREASQDIGSSRIHVGYLSHLVSYGVVGSFLLFYVWFALARDLYRKAKKSKFYGSFFAYLVFLFANATFPEFNMFFPGLILAVLFSEYFYRKSILMNPNLGHSNEL